MRPGRTRPVGGADVVALPHRQQPGRARVDRRRAAQAAGRRRPARLGDPPPRRGHDDRAQGRSRVSRGDGARGRRRRAAARLRRPRRTAAAALGGAPGGVPARRRGARPRDRADRPLALRRDACARARLRRAALADPASGVAGACGRAGGGRRRAADRLLRASEREQARPAAAARVRGAPARASRRAAAARRLRGARLRPRRPAGADRARRRGRDPRARTSRRRGSGR